VVRRFPGEAKVSWAENSDTASRDGAECFGAEKVTVATPRGTLLWAEDPALGGLGGWSEEDQEEEEEEEEEEEGAADF